MVQPRYRHNPYPLTRWTQMLAAPARDWSVFQQIFADHWRRFSMLIRAIRLPITIVSCARCLTVATPRRWAMSSIAASTVQGKHLVAMSCKSSLCLRCQGLYG